MYFLQDPHPFLIFLGTCTLALEPSILVPYSSGFLVSWLPYRNLFAPRGVSAIRGVGGNWRRER